MGERGGRETLTGRDPGGLLIHNPLGRKPRIPVRGARLSRAVAERTSVHSSRGLAPHRIRRSEVCHLIGNGLPE